MRSRDTGQTLVHVAVMLVGLLMAVGMVLDYGIALSERRNLQNAADAGALAGAHELCFGDRALAVGVAESFALANGAQAPVAAEILNQDGDVDAASGSIVQVETTTVAEATLLRLAGIGTYTVKAHAAAACGIAETSCGLWPLAFSEDVWNQNCGKVIYVWNAQNEQQEIDCSIDECDMDGDGVDDIVTGGGRGWVDFSDAQDPLYPDGCIQVGCGASEMSCILADGSKDRVVLPACLPGVGGVRASVVADALAQAGRQIKIPVFASTGCPAGRSCPNGESYYVERFGCAVVEPALEEWEVTCDAGTYPCYDPDKHQVQMSSTKKSTVIRVMIDCEDCTTACGETGGTAPSPDSGDVLAVSLID